MVDTICISPLLNFLVDPVTGQMIQVPATETQVVNPTTGQLVSQQQQMVVGPDGQQMMIGPDGQQMMIGPDGQQIMIGPDGQQMMIGPDGQYLAATQQVVLTHTSIFC